MVGIASSLPRIALVAAMLLPALTGGAAAQDKVGISSAVNPEALGTRPGATARQLVIGQDVIFNEHITTGPTGQTQLLFLDESAMTVGPNSDLVIDQFVYDPKSGTGKLAMSATRGLLRYVGGKLSKQDQAVTVRTTTATLAVRGGAFVADVASDGKTEAIFIFGDGLRVTANGVSQMLARPGYAIIISANGAMSQPFAVPAQTLAAYLQELNGRPGGSGGATVVPTDAVVTASGLPQTIATVAPAGAATTITSAERTVLSLSNATQTINPQPNSASQVIDCVTAGTCSSRLVTVNEAPNPSPSPSPSPVTVSYAGRLKNTNGNGTTTGFVDQTSKGDIAYSGGTLVNDVFTATAGSLGKISFPLVSGTASFGPTGTSSTLGTFSGTSFLSPDGTYFYASITPTSQPSERLFISGGLPVNATFYDPTGSGLRPQTGSNTRVFAFTVQTDTALRSTIPFVRPEAGGNLANASVSPLYVVAPPATKIGDASTVAATRALQGSLAIDGTGANQRSTIAVNTGTFDTLGSSNLPILSGQLRGSSLQAASGSPVRINSAVSSVVDANGNSFYGGDAITGFALDQTAYNTGTTLGTLGAAKIPSTAGEATLTGATTNYGFAQAAVSTAVPAGVGTTRTTQTLSGNFGGLMYSGAQSSPYIVTGGTTISTDATNNRVEAKLAGTTQSASSGVDTMTMQYGGLTGDAAGRQAFVDNKTFAALESQVNPQQINGKNLTVNGDTTQAGKLFLMTSGVAAPPTSLLSSGASYCDCQYLQWGYWGGDLLTGNATDSTISRIDRGHINTWVAGVATPLSDLNTLQSQSALGTYNGHAIGSVFNNGSSYVAAGGFKGVYNFGTQNATMTISNFDGRTFTSSGKVPLTGATYTADFNSTGVKGTINGTFYGPKAAETGGSFSVQSTTGPSYLASGIYAGKQ